MKFILFLIQLIFILISLFIGKTSIINGIWKIERPGLAWMTFIMLEISFILYV